MLSLLRHALGTQTTPPNQVLIGLALFLTFFVMSPVLDKVYTDAYVPLRDSKITVEQAMDTAATPLRQFMLKQTREPDLALFVKMGNMPPIASPEQTPMRALIPAFVTSELKSAFQIGFAIFIPFLVIDIVVAAVLMSMGMMMVTPSIFSLPFKIEYVLDMARQAMQVAMMVGAPMLLVSLVVGLLMAVFQAATQLNEQSLSFIPKLVAVAATMILAGPWLVSVIVDYTRDLLTNIPNYVN